MKRVFCLLSFVCICFLAACNASPMLVSPALEANYVTGNNTPADEIAGTWYDAKGGCTITVERVVAEKEKSKQKSPEMFVIQYLEKPDAKRGELRPLPFDAFPVRYKGVDGNFLVLKVDEEQICQTEKLPFLLMFASRPLYFLAQINLQKDGMLEVAFIAWSKKENGETILKDPSIKLVGDAPCFVVNSTEEIVESIENKKFFLVDKLTFSREKPAPEKTDKTENPDAAKDATK